jgi:16S rRNA (uracil1498-N3)-methyltransferase
MHFQKIIRSACEQCGENWCPPFLAPLPYPHWLQQEARPVFLLDPQASGTMQTMAPQPAMVFVVGPEGGLTSEEKQHITACGHTAIRIGRHTLRMETACLAVLAAAHALWDS